MRYLMKCLQQVGLVSTLLTGGVLGGLMAPLPSEALSPSASPTVTLKMDAGNTLTLRDLGLITCSASDVSPGGYNYCYAVPTGGIVTGTSNRQYRIDPNGTPRVRIADFNGQDKMSLTGVQFVPVAPLWPNTESHTMTITLSATLDATTDGANGVGGATINQNNAGLYKWAVRSSGEFIANTGSDSVGNSLTLAGVGTFRADKTNRPILSTENAAARRGTKNLTTLSFTIAGPADTADINWGGLTNTDMGQQDLYFPEFDCSLNYGTNQVPAACRPTITQTLTATIKGPDTLRVLGGPMDAMGVKCSETFTAQQTKQITYLKGAVKILKILVPYINNQALKLKIQNLISPLDQILLSINTSSQDTVCPGAKVLAFYLGVEAAGDALTLLSRPSTPGIPAPLHHYVVVNSPGLTWEAARVAAQALGEGCDLATITSEFEQAIINGLLPLPSGLVGTHDYWVGGIQDDCEGGEEGGPGCHWRWINEEGEFWNEGPVVGMYANWGSTSTGPANEPNNLGGSENHLTVDSRWGWGWNDLNTNGTNGTTKGYIAEGIVGTCQPPVLD